jgi:hypothetical protein
MNKYKKISKSYKKIEYVSSKNYIQLTKMHSNLVVCVVARHTSQLCFDLVFESYILHTLLLFLRNNNVVYRLT